MPTSALYNEPVSIVCSIEGPTAFKTDGDGQTQIKLTVPPSELEAVKELMTGYREKVLIVVFTKRAL